MPLILKVVGVGSLAAIQSVAVAVVMGCIFFTAYFFSYLREKEKEREKTKRNKENNERQKYVAKTYADMIITVSTKEYENVPKIKEEEYQIDSKKMMQDLGIISIISSMLAKSTQMDSENDDGEPTSENQTEETINSVEDQSSEIQELYKMLRGAIKK